jgi:hypothetical protein
MDCPWLGVRISGMLMAWPRRMTAVTLFAAHESLQNDTCLRELVFMAFCGGFAGSWQNPCGHALERVEQSNARLGISACTCTVIAALLVPVIEVFTSKVSDIGLGWK